MSLTTSNKSVVKATYDFAVSGGAVGDISLDSWVPPGAVITNVYSREVTSATSGGSATVTLSAGSTALTGATAIADVATGSIALASSATAVVISASSRLKITVGTAALTAGKVEYFIEYIDNN